MFLPAPLLLFIVDLQHQRIHGLIPHSLGNLFGKELQVGQIYEISNFKVVPYTQKFKCFQSTFQIILTNATKVHALSSGNEVVIPRYVFEFTDLYHFLPEVHEKYLLHGK